LLGLADGFGLGMVGLGTGPVGAGLGAVGFNSNGDDDHERASSKRMLVKDGV
jgi:hypothetical protein